MEKKFLTFVATILATGAILNTIYDMFPKPVEGKQDTSFEADYQADIEYFENTDIAETILEEGISTSIFDEEYQRKVDNVRTFLQKRNSPLAAYAEVFVEAADEHEIDYRLLAAISIVESSGGIYNFRRHNAWGWGKSHFDSWEDGIWSVSEGIANGYYAKGLDTPARMAPRYCPPNSANWARKVTNLMNQIEK